MPFESPARTGGISSAGGRATAFSLKQRETSGPMASASGRVTPVTMSPSGLVRFFAMQRTAPRGRSITSPYRDAGERTSSRTSSEPLWARVCTSTSRSTRSGSVSCSCPPTERWRSASGASGSAYPPLVYPSTSLPFASSRYRHNAFASRICRGLLHSGSNSRGDATRMHAHRAREVATFSRLRL